MSQNVSYGWQRNPEAVKRVLATLPIPHASGCKFNFKGSLPTEVYGWELQKKAYSRMLSNWDQGQVGRCVGFGSAKAFCTSQAADIVAGQREKPVEYSPDAMYIGSRTECGQTGGGDGSVGAWAAKFIRDFGGLPKGTYDGIDFDDALDAELCRRLADTKLPDAALLECRKHPAKEVTLVTSWDDALKFLAKGCFIFVCSDQGFTQTRNSKGICKPSGTWMHCMAIIGYADAGNQGFIDNSWSDSYFKGPMGPGEGPRTGFYAESRVLNRMLGQEDSFAIFDPEGIADENRTFDFYY